MGGLHSKHRAKYTNDLQYQQAEEDDQPCCALSCLFPPKSGGVDSNNDSRHSNGHISRNNNSGTALDKKEYDAFGSPLPDTPEAVRRVRDRAIEKYYADEEKKSPGGENNNGYVRSNSDYLKSSHYGGIEKEGSSGQLDEVQSHIRVSQNGGSHGGAKYSAEIYDGEDAESKLYQKYELCEVLGVGSTSTCHRCVELSTNESRACKIVDKTDIDLSKTMIDQFYTEIKTLRSLHHPNIIQLYDVYITDDKIYIIMEIMHGGELFDYVVQKGTLTEEEASRIVRKVTSALVYMHSRNVMHRDMKPENLLLAHKPRSSHDIEVKIIDFGLSKILSDDTMTGSFLGTRGYLAPEMIQRRTYTKSVDAWALGVVIFVLVCGCLPFDDDCQTIPKSPDLRAKFTLRFPRWAKDLSPSARDLLSKLLHIDPNKRYTAEQAMEHPWVKGVTASKDSLLQSPGRIKPSPGRKHGMSSQATKDHVSQMVANRAIANAQLAGARSPKVHVRKTSI